MATYKLKRKTFTKWDETDTLKGMKDADILAQKKKSQSVTEVGTSVAGNALKGAALGGATLGAAGLLTGGAGKAGFVNKMKGAGKGAGKLGKIGAIGGAIIGAGVAASKANKQANENAFYNDRLKYAQRQAVRRERKDWKTNMTQREGYSY